MNHIKCTTEENKSWCGSELDGTFYFKDAEAAAINGVHGQTPVCGACVDVITNVLFNTLNQCGAT